MQVEKEVEEIEEVKEVEDRKFHRQAVCNAVSIVIIIVQNAVVDEHG
jgi:hypothetical protein